MCTPTRKIKFCTCSKTAEVLIDFTDEVERLYMIKRTEATMAQLNGNYLDTYFKWTLKRFKEDASARVMGSIVAPRRKLTELLTQENICDVLNA
ncbi:hypothetical protein [Kordia sp.]|uniref:hypothetical protein n=1 Tax=Kordia sp. TaxID=1965332 RepID=UPI003B5C8D9A